MAEYIEREALIEELERIYHAHYVKAREQSIHDVFNAVFKRLSNAPAADVVEVVHARWIRYHEADFGWDEWGYRCSNCGWEVEDRNFKFPSNFCPLCGTKMDGERRSE